LAALRWWAEGVGRKTLVARSNEHYGIPDPVFAGTGSKAKTLNGEVLKSGDRAGRGVTGNSL